MRPDSHRVAMVTCCRGSAAIAYLLLWVLTVHTYPPAFCQAECEKGWVIFLCLLFIPDFPTGRYTCALFHLKAAGSNLSAFFVPFHTRSCAHSALCVCMNGMCARLVSRFEPDGSDQPVRYSYKTFLLTTCRCILYNSMWFSQEIHWYWK